MKKRVMLTFFFSVLPMAVFAKEPLQVPGENAAARLRWIFDALLPVPKAVWITFLVLAALILGAIGWYQMGKGKPHGKKK